MLSAQLRLVCTALFLLVSAAQADDHGVWEQQTAPCQWAGGPMNRYLPHSTFPGTHTLNNCVGDFNTNIIDSEAFDPAVF